jgi:hypothetical protein
VQTRKVTWDEEDRIRSVDLNGVQLPAALYNAAGERTDNLQSGGSAYYETTYFGAEQTLRANVVRRREERAAVGLKGHAVYGDCCCAEELQAVAGARMVRTMDHHEIAIFWTWFATHADNIAAAALAAQHGRKGTEALEALDGQLARLGHFSWEVGPGERAANALAISPSGDHEQLGATRAIVAKAPSIPGWEFHPAKPPRRWDYTFRLDATASSYEIHAANWRYVLISYPDATYDLDIMAADLAGLPEERRQEALEIAVEGAVGEEIRINYIGDIRLVETFESGKGIPLPTLREHLADLIHKALERNPHA